MTNGGQSFRRRYLDQRLAAGESEEAERQHSNRTRGRTKHRWVGSKHR
jgi:hypothetical protein